MFAVTESFKKLRKASKKTERATVKICVVLTVPSRRSVKRKTINGVTYEGLAEFIYLGTLISNDDNVEKEIRRRILAGNRTYFAAIRLFRSRLLPRGTKILLI
jgi:LysM repeat protein